MARNEPQFTPRQREILRRLVEEYVETGQPVGSKYLVERTSLGVSASTVRSELAELEQRGMLTHPHTSAGRVPTEEGYRAYAEGLLDRLESRPSPLALGLDEPSELEPALQAATERLSELTRLLALVSAPPLQSTTVRHVEVLLLQPQVVMVVVITAAGGVSKRTYSFGEPVDPGLAKWAGEYLNERISGEERAALLGLLRESFVHPARPFIRVGRELDLPAPGDVALVGAAYGLLNRSLGAVSLLGPVRMDYEKAIRTVRAAARELSRVAEEVYAEP
jgi:heat-inducible transcriptional repressor